MPPLNKKLLTEADIRTKFITPAIVGPGGSKWDVMTQVLEERHFTKGRVIVRGKTVKRGESKKADCVLSPLAEQRRIVAKVEQLMALVDALETQLAAGLVAELTFASANGASPSQPGATPQGKGRKHKKG